MGIFKNFKDRLKAVDNLTKDINNGDVVVDRKNLEIKKNDDKKDVKQSEKK
ncbi:MAG: hypothetical protein IJR66_04955 [Clostridia bacterium]|nr:hypothetical protein [Clostridia bacterium]MBQ9514306.1 hypothetical protein [Clostridia bacterium]